jgi:hypothetical protein
MLGYQQPVASLKQADFRDIFRKASQVSCTSTLVCYSITTSAMKTPENTNEDPDDPEPADAGDIQTEYCSD